MKFCYKAANIRKRRGHLSSRFRNSVSRGGSWKVKKDYRECGGRREETRKKGLQVLIRHTFRLVWKVTGRNSIDMFGTTFSPWGLFVINHCKATAGKPFQPLQDIEGLLHYCYHYYQPTTSQAPFMCLALVNSLHTWSVHPINWAE